MFQRIERLTCKYYILANKHIIFQTKSQSYFNTRSSRKQNNQLQVSVARAKQKQNAQLFRNHHYVLYFRIQIQNRKRQGSTSSRKSKDLSLAGQSKLLVLVEIVETYHSAAHLPSSRHSFLLPNTLKVKPSPVL